MRRTREAARRPCLCRDKEALEGCSQGQTQDLCVGRCVCTVSPAKSPDSWHTCVSFLPSPPHYAPVHKGAAAPGAGSPPCWPGRGHRKAGPATSFVAFSKSRVCFEPEEDNEPLTRHTLSCTSPPKCRADKINWSLERLKKINQGARRLLLLCQSPHKSLNLWFTRTAQP